MYRLFTARSEAARHLDNGSGRVLISAPGKDADKTIVFGVNDGSLDANDFIVSNASCTTNCLAPVAKVLDEACGIEKGYMTTIHSYTGDQPTLDAVHADPYRARAAALSMIPTVHRCGESCWRRVTTVGGQTRWIGNSGANAQRLCRRFNLYCGT